MLRPMVPIGRHSICGARVWQSTSIAMELPTVLPSKIGQQRLLQASATPSCATSLQIEATYPSGQMVMADFLETLHHAMEHPWKSTLKGPQLLLQSGMVQTMHLSDIVLQPTKNRNTSELRDDNVELKFKTKTRIQNEFNNNNRKENFTGKVEQEKLLHSSTHPSSRVQQPNYHEDLKLAIHHQNPIWAMSAYRNCISDHEKMSATTLYQLFKLQCTINPIHANEILTHMEKSYGTPRIEVYELLCHAVGLLNHKQHGSILLMEKFVTQLRAKFITFDYKMKERLFPRLLVAFVKQKESIIGTNAQNLYHFMKNNNFPFPVKYMEQAMECARHNRAHELPYHELLQQCVEQGHQPNVTTAISVLQNLFPFNDFDAIMTTLEAISELHAKDSAYQIDIGTLELITGTAATRGRHAICLKVWDTLEAQGIQPTETIYENTCTAFAMAFRQDDNCFAVLGEMEAKGYTPSRALIRSISRSLRNSVGRVDKAYYSLVRDEIAGARLSKSSLHVVMSASAELGEVDRAFATIEDFNSWGLEPDEDSYSYLMEALSKATGSDRNLNKSDAVHYLAAAESMLGTMTEKNIKINRHTLHYYVHTLGNCGHAKEACKAVLDALEFGLEVDNKTLNLLITDCGKIGDSDMARFLCSKLTEPMEFLTKRFETWGVAQAEATPGSSNDGPETNG